MSEMSQSDMLKKVEDVIERHQPSGYRLCVDREAVRQEDDWLYIVVTPDRHDVRTHEYADKLADIEEKLRDEEDLKVLLVPALVDN